MIRSHLISSSLLALFALIACAGRTLVNAQAPSNPCDGLTGDAFNLCNNCRASRVPGASASTADSAGIFALFGNTAVNLCRACGDIPDADARSACFQCIQSSTPAVHGSCLWCTRPLSYNIVIGTPEVLVDLNNDYQRMAKCFRCAQSSGIDSANPDEVAVPCVQCGAAQTLELMDKCIQCATSPVPSFTTHCMACITPQQIYAREPSVVASFGGGNNLNSQAKCLDCVRDSAINLAGPSDPWGRCYRGALIENDQVADKYFQCVRSRVPGTYNAVRVFANGSSFSPPRSHCDLCFIGSINAGGISFPEPSAPRTPETRVRCMDGMMRGSPSPSEIVQPGALSPAFSNIATCSIIRPALQTECIDCVTASLPVQSASCITCSIVNIQAAYTTLRPIFGNGTSLESRRQCMQCLKSSPPPGVALQDTDANQRCTKVALFDDTDADVRNKYLQCALSSEPGNFNFPPGSSTRTLCDLCVTYGTTKANRMRCMDCLMKSTPDYTINAFNLLFSEATRSIRFNTTTLTIGPEKIGCFACAQLGTPELEGRCFNCMESSVPPRGTKASCFPGAAPFRRRSLLSRLESWFSALALPK